MTEHKITTNLRLPAAPILFATAALAAAVLMAGCGGTTVNGSLGAATSQTCVAFGVDATAAIGAGKVFETSGFGSASNSAIEYITGATASTAVVPPTIQGSSGTIPLGFAPNASGGTMASLTTMVPIAPSATGVFFGASITNGANGTTLYTINPNSVVLTSPEDSEFSEQLSFTSAATGPLANATYQTGAFTLPFSTTGLHTVMVSVSDSKPETTTTTYKVMVLPATGVGAAYISTMPDGTTPIAAGSTVTITGEITPTAPATDQATADEFGTVILFAAPGAQTLTITPPGGGTAVTEPVTITEGAVTYTQDKPSAKSAGHVIPVVLHKTH